MRLDYAYRRNGTRGFVQTISVTRAPADAKLLAYTTERILAKAKFAAEFAAVTDVPLSDGNDRHRFVRDTLRDVGIEPVPLEGFAVWVAKLRPMLQ
jgi:citrate lyase beta subunit